MSLQLLDTNAVIDFMKGVPSITAFVQRLDRTTLNICTCTVVMAEVCSGIAPERMLDSEKLLDSFLFLPDTAEIARQAGIWRYSFARRAITINLADALVAATAHHYDATLVTRNVRHFPMPELRVVSPEVSAG